MISKAPFMCPKSNAPTAEEMEATRDDDPEPGAGPSLSEPQNEDASDRLTTSDLRRHIKSAAATTAR